MVILREGAGSNGANFHIEDFWRQQEGALSHETPSLTHTDLHARLPTDAHRRHDKGLLARELICGSVHIVEAALIHAAFLISPLLYIDLLTLPPTGKEKKK